MSFQFPANPKDGDIVVQPIPEGGFLKGTYKEASNTWEVGELPEEPGVPGPQGPTGPPGPKGDPGKGLAISGIVDKYVDLPSAGAHPLQFWIVDFENKVYFSDGNQWYDQGGPIVGPQGEGLTSVTAEETASEYKVKFEGTIPELDLTTPNLKGATGAPGKGWNSTTIIDERPDNYQIRFNSDDGLEFTTDSILGPPGELEVASEDNCGCIKIGRGLDIAPDGSAASGETYVDLETVPLGTDGRPDIPTPTGPAVFQLSFVPAYFNKVDGNPFSTLSYAAGPTNTQSGTVAVPGQSNGAIVYFFTGSDVTNNFTPPGGYGLQWTVYAQLVSTLTIGGAQFVSQANNLGQIMVHNYSIGSEARRNSNQSSFKIGQITYPYGTTNLNLTVSTRVNAAQRATVQYGRSRVILIPYRDSDTDNPATIREIAARYGMAREIDWDAVPGSEPDTLPEPPTPEEIADQNAVELKRELSTELAAIDTQLNFYPSGSIHDQLVSIRQELYDLQTLPGTYEEINAEFERLAAQAEPYTRLSFRFESS